MKIGKYFYPLHDLASLVDEIKVLYDECSRNEITREHIAAKLKCSVKSGGFGQKLADFKAYGLLDGRGTFHVSDLAVKATYGTDKERAEAMDGAVRKIELWRLINAKWGTNVPPDTFWIDLAEIAGIERSESKKEADAVRKAYMDDARYLLTVKAPTIPPESEKDDFGEGSADARDRKKGMDTPSNATSMESPYIGFPDYIKTPIIIKDETSFKAAKVFWDAIEAKFTRKVSPAGNSETNQTSSSES